MKHPRGFDPLRINTSFTPQTAEVYFQVFQEDRRAAVKGLKTSLPNPVWGIYMDWEKYA